MCGGGGGGGARVQIKSKRMESRYLVLGGAESIRAEGREGAVLKGDGMNTKRSSNEMAILPWKNVTPDQSKWILLKGAFFLFVQRSTSSFIEALPPPERYVFTSTR